MRAGAWLLVACGVATLGAAAPAADVRADPGAAAPAHRDGIWKAAVPPAAIHAEFDRLDAYGLAVGARIPADCSLNWVDPDDGRRYCFASGTSLVYFLDAPHANIASARAAWKTLLDERR